MPCKLKFTLAVAEEAEVHAGAVVVEAAAHARAVDSRPPRLPLDRRLRLLALPVPALRLGQVRPDLPLVLDPQAVRQPVRGPQQVALLPVRLRKVALVQAEVL